MTIKERKRHYVRLVLKEIKDARETAYDFRVESFSDSAHGMIAAGLHLDVLKGAEFERLWDLASNAAQHRRRELARNQAPYTWKDSPATAKEAAA